jgi:hypothetical protein
VRLLGHGTAVNHPENPCLGMSLPTDQTYQGLQNTPPLKSSPASVFRCLVKVPPFLPVLSRVNTEFLSAHCESLFLLCTARLNACCGPVNLTSLGWASHCEAQDWKPEGLLGVTRVRTQPSRTALHPQHHPSQLMQRGSPSCALFSLRLPCIGAQSLYPAVVTTAASYTVFPCTTQ